MDCDSCRYFSGADDICAVCYDYKKYERDKGLAQDDDQTLADIRMDLAKAGDRIDSALAGKAINAELIGQADPNGIDAHAPGAKLDFGKNKWYLLPWKVIEGVTAVMTFGANKYSENGWQDVPQAKERYFAAMMRHWMLMNDGEYTDPDSGLPHWAHFCCNAVFLGYFHSRK